MSRTKKPSPYSMGFGGHAYSCDCNRCADLRANEMFTAARKRGVTLTPERTVAVRQYTVRAHARRNPRHLTKMPNTMQYLLSLTRSAVKKGK